MHSGLLLGSPYDLDTGSYMNSSGTAITRIGFYTESATSSLVKALTLIDSKADVAPPSSLVDEADERIDVRPALSTPHNR